MQINPKYRNNPTFNKALSTYSEATSSKNRAALGQALNHVPTTLHKAFRPPPILKIKAYRKFTIKLKERAGEILFNPKDKKQTVFAAVESGELIKKCR